MAAQNRFNDWLRSSGLGPSVLLAVPIGILAACVTSLFRFAIEYGTAGLFGNSADVTAAMAELNWVWRLLIPTFGGAAAGLFLWWDKRGAEAAGTADYMDAVSEGDGRIPLRASLLRSMSSLSTIVSGGSIGREAAMVQLAALSGSLSVRRWADTNTLRMCTACGAAAGLAAVYHTPLAGALFVAEVVLGSITVDRLIPLFTATVTATLVTLLLGSTGAPLALAHAQFTGNATDLLIIIPVAIMAGLLAPPFIALIGFSRRAFEKLTWPVPARMSLGGLMMGTIAIWVPEICGNGYEPIVAILHGTTPSVPVVVLLIAKVGATALIVGSGAIGGIFTPALFIGAALGATLAGMADWIPALPVSNGVLLALVGMAAFMAAISHAPLMAILMVFEMTLDASLLLPLMIACAVSYTVSKLFRSHSSIYAVMARRNDRQLAVHRFETLQVNSLVRPASNCLLPSATLRQAREQFAHVRTRYLYLVDETGKFMGALSVHKVYDALDGEPERADDTVRDLVDRDFKVLAPEVSLSDAWHEFGRRPLGRFPVVTAQGQFLGVVTKSDVLRQKEDVRA